MCTRGYLHTSTHMSCACADTDLRRCLHACTSTLKRTAVYLHKYRTSNLVVQHPPQARKLTSMFMTAPQMPPSVVPRTPLTWLWQRGRRCGVCGRRPMAMRSLRVSLQLTFQPSSMYPPQLAVINTAQASSQCSHSVAVQVVCLRRETAISMARPTPKL